MISRVLLVLFLTLLYHTLYQPHNSTRMRQRAIIPQAWTTPFRRALTRVTRHNLRKSHKPARRKKLPKVRSLTPQIGATRAIKTMQQGDSLRTIVGSYALTALSFY